MIWGKKKKDKSQRSKDIAKGKEIARKLAKKGKTGDYREAHHRANTGGSAFCDKCNVWYDMNDWYQFLAHDHT